MSRESIRGGGERATTLLVGAFLALAMSGFVWPWERSGPWPTTSDTEVAPLAFPTIESRIETRPAAADSGFRFVAYGDQRALADGEWQALVREIARVADHDPGLLFVLDTGDIVDDGRYSDQFAFLRDLLEPVRHLSYLVAIGNHEVRENRAPVARRHVATFLSGMDPDLSPDHLYFRKDVGPLRLLFLDTNDLVYGDEGDETAPEEPRGGSRTEAQLRWLERQLENDDRGPEALTIAVLHHPFLQSSLKHQRHAIALWSYRWHGRPLPDLLLDGGVDVVLTGHTHTTERFRLRRDSDGSELQLVNLSGRPRDGFLWFGDSERRPEDISGREETWLAEEGWRDLDGWTITQEHAMKKKNEADQFAAFRVGPDGSLRMEMTYVGRKKSARLRRDPVVLLH